MLHVIEDPAMHIAQKLQECTLKITDNYSIYDDADDDTLSKMFKRHPLQTLDDYLLQNRTILIYKDESVKNNPCAHHEWFISHLTSRCIYEWIYPDRPILSETGAIDVEISGKKWVLLPDRLAPYNLSGSETEGILYTVCAVSDDKICFGRIVYDVTIRLKDYYVFPLPEEYTDRRYIFASGNGYKYNSTLRTLHLCTRHNIYNKPRYSIDYNEIVTISLPDEPTVTTATYIYTYKDE